jgi:hypothetical protein
MNHGWRRAQNTVEGHLLGLPLDVGTRWNGGKEVKKEISRLRDLHPKYASLIPTVDESIVCEQVEVDVKRLFLEGRDIIGVRCGAMGQIL